MKTNWYLTYHYWPTSHGSHIFEGTLYFVPPQNAYERLQQELAVVTFKEYALQDGNTLEATQSMIETGVVDRFPLCDQEVMLRHLHTVARGYVDDFQTGRSTESPVQSVRLSPSAVLSDKASNARPMSSGVASTARAGKSGK